MWIRYHHHLDSEFRKKKYPGSYLENIVFVCCNDILIKAEDRLQEALEYLLKIPLEHTVYVEYQNRDQCIHVMKV